MESIADISVKLFEHRDDIFLFFQNISSANTSDIANFIDTVIADIDPELARSIKEDTDSYGVFLELINDDAGRIFLSYLGLIIGAVPPNFYAFLYGAAAAYIILEVLFCILLAFISGGLAVAARFAAIIARIAVMGMKVTAVNKRIASGARAVSAYIDSLKVIESSLKQLKAIGANTRRIKLKGQKASGSTGETLVIERKVVLNSKFPDGIAFNSNTKTHISTVEGFSQKKGVLGGHNLDAFNQVVTDKNLKILSSTDHPTVQGLTQIEYQIPSLDRAGNVSGYKNKVFSKTVYDPNVISDTQIIELGQQASAKGYPGATSQGLSQFTSEAGGIDFRVYIRNDIIDNFHPEF